MDELAGAGGNAFGGRYCAPCAFKSRSQLSQPSIGSVTFDNCSASPCSASPGELHAHCLHHRLGLGQTVHGCAAGRQHLQRRLVPSIACTHVAPAVDEQLELFCVPGCGGGVNRRAKAAGCHFYVGRSGILP